MAGPGQQAAVLRSAVAELLRERGAQEALLEVLAESDGEVQTALAESVALLAERFEEFAGLLSTVREGVRALAEAMRSQQAEN
jgi:acyl-CoA reductase-like NAD-dependent aldehyde dehydrogenase